MISKKRSNKKPKNIWQHNQIEQQYVLEYIPKQEHIPNPGLVFYDLEIRFLWVDLGRYHLVTILRSFLTHSRPVETERLTRPRSCGTPPPPPRKKTKRCVTGSKRGLGFWREQTTVGTHVTVSPIQQVVGSRFSQPVVYSDRRAALHTAAWRQTRKIKNKNNPFWNSGPAPAGGLSARGLLGRLGGVFAVLFSTLDLESETW